MMIRLLSLVDLYLHCKPIPCNENRVPAVRKGVPCNKNRFFPVRKTSQGKPCSGTVRDCSAEKKLIVPVDFFILRIQDN